MLALQLSKEAGGTTTDRRTTSQTAQLPKCCWTGLQVRCNVTGNVKLERALSASYWVTTDVWFKFQDDVHFSHVLS